MTREDDKAELRRKLAERDPWAESAPEPPDREAQLREVLNGRQPVTARTVLHLHRLAVDAAVTAVLDSLAAELASTGVMVDAGGAPHDVSDAYRFAADRVRARIPVPFG